MHNKKFLYSIILMFCLITMISFVSAVPPFQSTIVAQYGLEIEATNMDYLKQNTDHNFRFRVYNASNNVFMNDAMVNCSFGIVDGDGNYVYQQAVVTSIDYKFSVELDAGNFTQAGVYHRGINCITDNGDAGGVKT